ncbi:MAG TPA: ATP-dependent Clp protease proteolytic subunit [Jatrophihabitans sp.]|jgi:ATP-dependent Clp protease protease subunit|uniref:ATP-dependent Clp protease proteolytic subunit n=1 Tax=Jatrophihabitans sp. TaxID=1932789 RepID=UPI002EEB7125
MTYRSAGRQLNAAPAARSFLPRFVEQTSSGTRDYDPFSKLYEERIVFIGTVIDDITANDVIVQLLCLESVDPDREITIYINSPGGALDSLMAIYDTMQFIRPLIQTVCMGQANSAAAVLLGAGTKGKRFALPNARVLIHQPSSGGIQGQVSDLQIHAEEMSRLRDQLEEILAKHTGRSIAQIREDIERDRFLTAEEAVDYGLIDGVIQSRALAAAPA